MPTHDAPCTGDESDDIDLTQKHLLNLALLATCAVLALVTAAIGAATTGEGVARAWFTPGAPVSGWALVSLAFTAATIYAVLRLAHGFRFPNRRAKSTPGLTSSDEAS